MIKRVLFAFFVIVTYSVQATHLAGGEIEYKNIGFRKWEIKLVLYRECNSITSLCIGSGFGVNGCSRTLQVKPMANIAMGGLNPNTCNTNITPINITLTAYLIQDVEPLRQKICGQGAKNICDNRGLSTPGSFNPSIEAFYYKGILDMSSSIYSTACPYWVIGSEECCRSNSYSLLNSGATNFSIASLINIFHNQNSGILNNNSPEIRNNAIDVVCSGQEFFYNMGAVDLDGDSLTYALVPYRNFSTYQFNQGSFTYLQPFPLNSGAPPHTNYPQPNGPFVVLDSVTGDIGFNAINNNPTQPISGNFNIEITQWYYDSNKNPYVIGRTSRDMLIYVLNCPNNNSPKFATSPTLPNGNPKYNWSVCAGEQLCFTITAKDVDDGPGPQPSTKLDTSTLRWNGGISRPGKLTFVPDYDTANKALRPREDRWKFCWQTEESDGSNTPYQFTVSCLDNNCPNIGMATKAFTISVIPQAKIAVSKTNLTCGQWKYEIKKTDPNQVFSAARLDIAKEPNDMNFVSGSHVRFSANPNPVPAASNMPLTILSDSFSFSKPGKYYVKYSAFVPGLEAGQLCSKFILDSVTIDNSLLQITAQDVSMCKLNSVPVAAFASSGQGPYSYQWYRNSLSGNPLFTTSNFIANDTATTSYLIQVTDSINCTQQRTVVVKVNPLPQEPFNTINVNACIGAVYTFNAGGNSGNVRKYQWVKNNIVLADSLQQLQTTQAGTYVAMITDTLGCVQKDTVTLAFNTPPIVDAGNTITVCKNAPAFLISNQSGATTNSTIMGFTFWQLAPGQLPNISNAIVNGQSFEPANNAIPASGGTWKLYYKDTASGCLSIDSINITVRPLPMVTLIAAKDTVCSTDASLQLNGTPANGVYSGNAISNNGLFNIQNPAVLPNTNYSFSYRFTNNFGCADSALKTIFVLGTPTPLAITGNTNPIKNTTVNYNVSLIPNQSYVWSANKGVVQSSSLNTASVLWTDTGAAWVKVVTSNACGTATSEQNVQVAPTVGLNEANGLSNVTIYPNPTVGEVFITGNTSEQQLQIEVFNNTLQLVYSQNVKTELGQINAQFNTATLSNGLYFVKIGNGNKYGVYKLVVLR